jgi:hypothetical protein
MKRYSSGNAEILSGTAGKDIKWFAKKTKIMEKKKGLTINFW